MKQVKVILAMVLAISVFFTTSPSVLAQEMVDSDAGVEMVEGSETQSPADTASTLEAWNCLNCGVLCKLVCLDRRVWAETGSHNNGACYIDYYRSEAVVMCMVCYEVYWEYDDHWCIEDHLFCGLGLVDVCPMDIKID